MGPGKGRLLHRDQLFADEAHAVVVTPVVAGILHDLGLAEQGDDPLRTLRELDVLAVGEADQLGLADIVRAVEGAHDDVQAEQVGRDRQRNAAEREPLLVGRLVEDAPVEVVALTLVEHLGGRADGSDVVAVDLRHGQVIDGDVVRGLGGLDETGPVVGQVVLHVPQVGAQGGELVVELADRLTDAVHGGHAGVGQLGERGRLALDLVDRDRVHRTLEPVELAGQLPDVVGHGLHVVAPHEDGAIVARLRLALVGLEGEQRRELGDLRQHGRVDLADLAAELGQVLGRCPVGLDLLGRGVAPDAEHQAEGQREGRDDEDVATHGALVHDSSSLCVNVSVKDMTMKATMARHMIQAGGCVKAKMPTVKNPTAMWGMVCVHK